jgi:CDP-diacylglycerol--serine O-phosphatidyltransferase
MYGVVNYAQLLLLTLATAYVASGIVIRIGGILRRRLKPAHHAPEIKIA